VLPHSETRYSNGFAWFSMHEVGSDIDAPAIAAMADAITAFATDLAKHRPTLGKPIVTGFSQGGALSFTIAARHPDAIAAALPMSGWLPKTLTPTTAPAAPPPVFAFHGTADDRVAIDEGRSATARLVALKFPVTFREFDGVAHAIPPTVRAAWFEALTKACVDATPR
jgi:phospholipase/carboxylesterase